MSRNPYRDPPTVLIPLPMHVLDVAMILHDLNASFDGCVVDGDSDADHLIVTLRSHPGPDAEVLRTAGRCGNCGHRVNGHGASGCAADDEAAMGGCDCVLTPWEAAPDA